MASPLRRLYRTKLALLATVSTVVGLALLMLSRWLSLRLGWAWLSGLTSDVGGSLFSIGLLGVFFQYVGAADQQQEDDDRVRRMLKETAPDIRDAVVQGFAFAPDSLTSVASPAVLDHIIENCLSLQVGDVELASGAYQDLRERVVATKPRCYDAQLSVVLSPWDGGDSQASDALFAVTITSEYRVVPDGRVIRFSCVSDPIEYREMLDDPSSVVVWHFEPAAGLTAASPEAFRLLRCSLNGAPLKARRAARSQSQILSVDIGEAAATATRPVTLSFTYRAFVQRRGHLLHLDISQPTKGLSTEFWYGDCGIRRVNVLDYIAGAGTPRISQLPASDPTPSVKIGYDGWVFPKGGIAYVWVLESEMSASDTDDDGDIG